MFVIPFVGCVFSAFIMHSSRSPTWTAFWILTVSPALLSLFTPYIVRRKNIVGQLYYLLSQASVIISIMVIGRKESGWLSEIDTGFFEIAWVTTSGVLTIAFVIAVPFAIIPGMRKQGSIVPRHREIQIDTSVIQDAFSNVQKSFVQIQSAAARETKILDEAIDALKKQIFAQQTELERTNKQLTIAEEEVAEHKALASMTNEQRDAIIRLMSNRKNVDYIVGFVLGVLGSALVQYLPNFLGIISE